VALAENTAGSASKDYHAMAFRIKWALDKNRRFYSERKAIGSMTALAAAMRVMQMSGLPMPLEKHAGNTSF